jgi:hypothetical protein
MPKYFPRQLLYRLRNEIPMERLIVHHLDWPHKHREGRFCFLCTRCGELLATVNPRTNLGRCFRCDKNFNTIDLVMLITERDFVETVHFLEPLLPPQPSTTKPHPSTPPSR